MGDKSISEIDYEVHLDLYLFFYEAVHKKTIVTKSKNKFYDTLIFFLTFCNKYFSLFYTT